MEVSQEDRRKQLLELKEFIRKSKEQLDLVLKTLGWNRDQLLKQDTKLVLCPLNPEHRMPQSSLERHVEKCSLHQEGYRSDEEFLSSSNFPSSPSVVIDANILQQVLGKVSPSNHPGAEGVAASESEGRDSARVTRGPPRTSERLLTDFSPAERSALHQYVVSRTTRSATALSVDDLQLPLPENKQSRLKSKLELLAEQRDAKRRRMNHKKVHTSRKTHTEVLREVIRNQMEYLLSQNLENSSDP